MRRSTRTNRRPKRSSRGGSASRTMLEAVQPYTIVSHRLRGPGVTFRDTPNRGDRITPAYVIFHYTAGRNAQASCDWLCNPLSQASAHLVIARDGSITQLAPFNVKTWHAGVSQWEGLSGLNQYAIGIEMDNAGPLTVQGDALKAWFGAEYPRAQAVQATHRFDQAPKWWHTYTEIQIQRAFELALLLVHTYELRDVIGHDDVAPNRKRDPGPAFPLEPIRSRVLGRRADERERVRVVAEALNIRTGPGTEFPLAGDPLPKHTEVFVLEKGARWTKVDVSDETDLEGWVINKFIEPVSG